MTIKEKILIAIEKGYYCDTNGNVFSKFKKLSLCGNSKGYYHFSIRINKNRYPIQVHQFVAYLKFGDKIFDDNIEVRHLNGNSLNNCWDNIDIGSHIQNMGDIPQKILISAAIAGSKSLRRFTDEEVKNILSDRIQGLSYSKLCEKYNTSKSTLSYLFNEAYYSGARKL
ncbi:MAG: HNH endonuclease [Dehalococcoidia bacterium]|jgi:hypothetical protein